MMHPTAHITEGIDSITLVTQIIFGLKYNIYSASSKGRTTL